MFNPAECYLALDRELRPAALRVVARMRRFGRISGEQSLRWSEVWCTEVLLKRIIRTLSRQMAQCRGGVFDEEFENRRKVMHYAAECLLVERVHAAKEAGLDPLLFVGDSLVASVLAHLTDRERDQLEAMLFALL